MNKRQLLFFAAYSAPFYFIISPWYRFVLFALGVLLGFVFLLLDQKYLYPHYLEEEQLKKIRSGINFPALITRSTLFLVVLVPLSLFVVTSTGSALGSGLIMGLLMGLVMEMWQYYQLPKAFNQQFLYQGAKSLKASDIKKVVFIATAYFVLLNLLVIV